MDGVRWEGLVISEKDVVLIYGAVFVVSGACDIDGDLALVAFPGTFLRQQTSAGSPWAISEHGSIVDLTPGLSVRVAAAWAFEGISDVLVVAAT